MKENLDCSISKEFPWMLKPLDEWSIMGMNHYHVQGQRYLYVAMSNNGRCIQEEGRDEDAVWNRLRCRAVELSIE